MATAAKGAGERHVDNDNVTGSQPCKLEQHAHTHTCTHTAETAILCEPAVWVVIVFEWFESQPGEKGLSCAGVHVL